MVAPTAFQPALQLPSVDGLVFRHLDAPADYAAMNDIANASRVAAGASFVTSLEDLAAFYSHLSNCDPSRDVVIVEVAGRVVGYGRCGWRDERTGARVYEVICFLEPAWTRRGIGRALLRTLEARTREVMVEQGASAPAAFEAEGTDRDTGRQTLLLQEGYQAVRFVYEMLRPDLADQHDAPLPAGLEIRDVRPAHLPAIWAADQEAFADHWGASLGTDAEYQQFLTNPTMNDASLWRVAWDGDQVAGQVRSFINAEENQRYGRHRGWVEHISVRRPWRHRGLARALIAASLPLLRARGMTEGALSVDTQNASGALRVYESMGFLPVSRETTYRKPLA